MSTAPPILSAMPGCLVTRLTVDDSFTLTLCGIDREIILRIDGEGEVEFEDGSAGIDPDRNPASAVALIGLLNRHVDSVDLAADGTLSLSMPASRLTVRPSEHTLSWSISGPDGTRASCIAEGRVVWE